MLQDWIGIDVCMLNKLNSHLMTHIYLKIEFYIIVITLRKKYLSNSGLSYIKLISRKKTMYYKILDNHRNYVNISCIKEE